MERAKRPPPARECAVPAFDWAGLGQIDFADAFSIELRAPVDARDAARRLVAAAPWWITALMVARNAIVVPFGLQGSRAGTGTTEVSANTSVGPFRVVRADEAEVLVATDDRHLDGRLALVTRGGRELVAITAVSFNGRLGRGYFAIVKPFHRRIVPTLLRSVARQLDG